jgi:hypothetical protein
MTYPSWWLSMQAVTAWIGLSIVVRQCARMQSTPDDACIQLCESVMANVKRVAT